MPEEARRPGFNQQLTGSEAILLVDDDAPVRELMREILEQYGYRVLEAANSAAALALCSRADVGIDLLLTDLAMPELKGWDLGDVVAAARPKLRSLVISADGDDALRRRGGADRVNFLQKPFTPVALAHKVREVLDRT
jgi:CheY-like chemotaxis protein